LAFGWEPPEYIERNGKISQYEYELTGIDEWNQGTRESVSPRTRADIGDLMPGSLYRFKVRAFTSSAGPGPWSEPIDARTTGEEKNQQYGLIFLLCAHFRTRKTTGECSH
jgi:hypothetical protein